MIIFTLQAVLMPGAMAAGHMLGMSKVSFDVSLQDQDAGEFQTKASDIPVMAKEQPMQNHQNSLQKSASCCVVDCGCASFLVLTGPLFTSPVGL